MNGVSKRSFVGAVLLFLIAGWMTFAVNGEELTKGKVIPAKKDTALGTLPSADLAISTQSGKIQQTFFPALTKRESKIQEALNADTECSFENAPLNEVMAKLSERHEIPILILMNDLGEEGLTVEDPVTISLSTVSLKNALDLILKPIGLTYVVDCDVLKITTIVKADEIYTTRVYPVGDYGNTPEVYIELVEAIKNANLVTNGTISVVQSSGALVISESYHSHNEIVKLLTQLRQAKAMH